MEGFRFVNRTAPIRALLLLLGLVSLVGMPYVVLMPIFADRILHGGARGLGILMGATGVGALLGALTLAFRARREGTGTMGSLVQRRLRREPGGVCAFRCRSGFPSSCCCRWVTPSCCRWRRSNTLIQVMVPDALRGRVMAVYSMMFMGMAPMGALLGGALADRLGAPFTVAIGGLASMAAACWFGLHLPKIRVEARRLILAQAMAGGEPAEGATTRVADR